jgi:hypothetical protein
MGNAAHEHHTFHILQRLLEAKNVSVIEDDCPNRTLLRETSNYSKRPRKTSCTWMFARKTSRRQLA